jgi:hypothetical protein
MSGTNLLGDDIGARIVDLAIPRRRLYQNHGDTPLIELLLKATPDSVLAGSSNQGVMIGPKQHPFNMREVSRFQLENTHHSTCLNTKKESTVGLGFVSDKVATVLDPLCRESWQHTLSPVAEDYWQCGNGYLEVVRNDPSNRDRVTGLHHIPATDIAIWIDEPVEYHMHYQLLGREQSHVTNFAVFGDLLDYEKRLGLGQIQGGARPSSSYRTSEVIHFKRPSALSRWYGYPDWLAAVAACELVQALHQHNFDFFTNRGVPEFMLFLLGKKLAPEDWEKVEKALKAQVGLGNSHKSLALNLQDPEMKVQLEKLAMEGKSDATLFPVLSEALALEIVSCHRVPPLLAGIVIPGRLGSANELPNALMAFQILVVGPAQQTFESMLNNTLGNPLLNGGLDLRRGDFKLKKITDEMNLMMQTPGAQTMTTIGGMRQTLPEAQAQGRDLQAGFKKEEEPAAQLVAALLSIALERRMAREAGAAA